MGSKAKGSSFERFVAKEISKWITKNPNTEPLIWRSSNSGGTFTVNARKNKQQKSMAGDLVAIDERAKFFMDKISVECKTGYKTANLFSTFKEAKNDILRGFWEQASGDAEKSEKIPMLVFKPLGNKVLVGFPSEFVNSLFSELKVLNHMVIIKFNNKLSPLMLFEFDEVFKIITPEIFKERV